MRRLLILICTLSMFVLVSGNLKAQLIITDGGSPANLVQNVLLGEGVTASNITFTGAPLSIGTFTTGPNPTNLGLSSGLILSTGKPSLALGPNSSGSMGFGHGTPGDALLTELANQNTFDAAILEFDFIPQGDTLEFRYVFGSEEYPEFVVGLMNDIFGFFLTGLNPVTYETDTNRNIALVPGTTNVVVSIGTINNVLPGCYPEYYVNNAGGTTIQYDGFTTVLTAWTLVVPCTPYHIRLAIADGGDPVYDSGVFLEAGSFSSAAIQTDISYTNPGMDTNSAIEGCVNAVMTFKLAYPTPTGYMIPYTILDNSTAIYGVDYDSIQSPLLIPIGEDSASIVIQPKIDGLLEGNEWVGIIVPTNICLTEFDTVYFNISDYFVPQITASPDFSTPCGDTSVLLGLVQGGMHPMTYAWSNAVLDSINPVSPLATQQYFVSVTDACNNSDTDSVTVNIYGPFADAGPDTTICHGGTASLTAAGGTSYLWSNGATTASIAVSPLVTTQYIVTVTATCSDVDTVMVFVNPLPVITLFATLDSICPGTSTQLVASGGSTYAWSSTPADPSLAGQDTLAAPVVSPATQTLYSVTVTTAFGCVASAMHSIAIRPVPSSDFVIDFHSLCVGASTLIHYNGTGYPSATYNWDFGGGLASGSGMGPYSVHWDSPGFHVVSLDLVQNGCPGPETKDSVFIIPVPVVNFTSDVRDGCPPLDVSFTDLTQNASSSAVYEWYFGNGNKTFIQNPDYTYNKSGFYAVTLVVTNTYGCADSLTIPAYMHVFEVPEANFAIHPKQVSIFDPIVKFNDQSLGFPVAWDWDFGDGTHGSLPNLSHMYADTGRFQVTLMVINADGCTDTAFNQVRVYPDNTLFVPNAFSPNGDAENNIFRAYGVNVSGFQMMIFNRWGEMVFSSDDIEKGWDGTYKGSPLPPEVFTVVIYYNDALGARKNFYNKVLLLR